MKMKTKEATIRARIEPDLKEEVENILNRISISTAEAIRIFMNQIRLHNGIPYPLQVPSKITTTRGGGLILVLKGTMGYCNSILVKQS